MQGKHCNVFCTWLFGIPYWWLLFSSCLNVLIAYKTYTDLTFFSFNTFGSFFTS